MLIALRDATVTFEGARHPSLDRVSFSLRSGSWTAVVGANGSGKSTLLGVLAGLVPLQSGSVERDGTPRVALLPQDADNHLVEAREKARWDLFDYVELLYNLIYRHSARASAGPTPSSSSRNGWCLTIYAGTLQ